MRRVLPACFLAVCVAGSAAYAQDTTVKSKTKIKADDAHAMTVTGCLGGGPTSFSLSSVASGDPHEGATVPHEGARPSIPAAQGTSGVVTSYDLTPRAGVDLSSHVGQVVEISGMMIPAATKGDDDAKIKVKDDTKVKADDAPDQKVKSNTKAEIARGATPKLAVMSVRMVSPSCQ